MPIHSILWPRGVPAGTDDRREPAYFSDLNLDQVVANVTAGKDGYMLMPLFYAPLTDVDAVCYRQEVFRDLERDAVREIAAAFAQRTVVATHAQRLRAVRGGGSGHYHRARWFLNTAAAYCEAVTALAAGLAEVGVRSRGLVGLRDYLREYVDGATFTALQAEINRLLGELDAVRYCIVINSNQVTVGPYSDEADYSAQVASTFERFRQHGAGEHGAGEYRNEQPDVRDEEFAELDVLNMVAKLYPELFAALDAFCQQHAGYLDDTVALADREFQFYVSYLDFIAPLRSSGLTFDYPHVSAVSKDEQVLDVFDVALASQLSDPNSQLVCNDIGLAEPERLLVISGPNNGGKTTLARTFGQVHYLAALGCPVPGREVRLFLCDQIFTHFERQEDITTFEGKLQEELDRLRADLQHASSASVMILNEVFNSTTAADASFLTREILERVSELDALGVCVTFLDELSTLNEKTVSMVSQVEADDPAVRTHKVIRTRADGRAYAHAIAEKYGLTYQRITAARGGR